MASPSTPSSRQGELVLLGVITDAHGIKGEVKLKSFTADPQAIADYGPLVTAKGEAIEIARMRPQKDGFIAALKGVSDRNRAEALKGKELFVAREKLPEAALDEVYVNDMIGLKVECKDGSFLGEVIAMPNFGAGDLLDVRVEGLKDTVLIPFADAFVLKVDVAKRRVVVDLPDGYLDEKE